MFRILFFSLALAAAPVDRPKLPPDLDRIVQLANATPPEFAADALLRVAAVTSVDTSLRKELIDRAFHLAAGAQLHTPLTSAGQVVDTSAAMLVAASRLHLDALTLQTRAVRSMLDLDAKAAREFFLEIAPPQAATTCDQPLAADVSALYDTLALVANSTFTDKERKKEQHVNLVLSYMSRASTPAEIAPIERMISNLNISEEQRDVLVTRLNGLRQSLVTPVCPEKKPVQTFWTSDQGKRLFEGGVRLRSTDTAQRDKPEWYQQLADYQKDLAGWNPSDEKDEATYFHQKSIIYEMLVELIPRSVERDKAIRDFVDFVAGSNLQREKPAEWYSHAQSLITRAGNLNLDPAKIWSAFENSGNPVLMLYASLEHRFISPAGSRP